MIKSKTYFKMFFTENQSLFLAQNINLKAKKKKQKKKMIKLSSHFINI